MKITLLNGSPRKNGNTQILLERMCQSFNAADINTEILPLGRHNIRGCLGCGQCKKNLDEKCIQTEDPLNEYLDIIKKSDGLVIGSPVYFSGVTSQVKAFIDRCGYVARANNDMLKHKAGAAVVAVRRAGALPTFNTINQFFLISQMFVPGSRYWNLGLGGAKGTVSQDEEGLETMDILSENMIHLLQKLGN
ncbi:MAG: flavodoxin family protein [Myxococcota bacterium]